MGCSKAFVLPRLSVTTTSSRKSKSRSPCWRTMVFVEHMFCVRAVTIMIKFELTRGPASYMLRMASKLC